MCAFHVLCYLIYGYSWARNFHRSCSTSCGILGLMVAILCAERRCWSRPRVHASIVDFLQRKHGGDMHVWSYMPVSTKLIDDQHCIPMSIVGHWWWLLGTVDQQYPLIFSGCRWLPRMVFSVRHWSTPMAGVRHHICAVDGAVYI